MDLSDEFQCVKHANGAMVSLTVISGAFPWMRAAETRNGTTKLYVSFENKSLPITKLQNLILDTIEKHPDGVTSHHFKVAAEREDYRFDSVKVMLSNLRGLMRREFGHDLLIGRSGNRGKRGSDSHNTKKLTYKRL